ncbi:MAG: hypothetical protein Q7V62_07835 [Actinomycetota bacterium]|nr:hypothetical protein [Actinomycetota bacterium]
MSVQAAPKLTAALAHSMVTQAVLDHYAIETYAPAIKEKHRHALSAMYATALRKIARAAARVAKTSRPPKEGEKATVMAKDYAVAMQQLGYPVPIDTMGGVRLECAKTRAYRKRKADEAKVVADEPSAKKPREPESGSDSE